MSPPCQKTGYSFQHVLSDVSKRGKASTNCRSRRHLSKRHSIKIDSPRARSPSSLARQAYFALWYCSWHQKGNFGLWRSLFKIFSFRRVVDGLLPRGGSSVKASLLFRSACGNSLKPSTRRFTIASGSDITCANDIQQVLLNRCSAQGFSTAE